MADAARNTDSPDTLPAPATDWSADLTTRTGYAFYVRPITPDDEAALADFFTHVGKEDLRFRFLSAINHVGHEQLLALLRVDHEHSEHFLACEIGSGRILATAMLVGDDDGLRAEVAVAIRSDFKRRGISWVLLDHVAMFARAKGLRTLESIESRDNHQAIDMERERGWTAAPCPGDPSAMILRLTLASPPA
ncbi:GNAT family N-acetyltransferase [Sphingomonas sp. BK481]|jgi:GNAT superfamily N-acetyltransferase|uniref:GNAT family N-acetyltransferase n=1 Tax=Sphingomonas sp. BK481 TaxID=2586981 RepID=UPI00161D098E|nr:GNAT family N-acetyltransferase [Sphingomonas sp. BK481]MBB3587030.1 acetyltransferase [Sphingomonas sp. BK481]